MSACLVAAMFVNATRSFCVILCPASIPASSAFSCASCSLACTVAISPMAWLCWSLVTTLSVWVRNSLTCCPKPEL